MNTLQNTKPPIPCTNKKTKQNRKFACIRRRNHHLVWLFLEPTRTSSWVKVGIDLSSIIKNPCLPRRCFPLPSPSSLSNKASTQTPFDVDAPPSNWFFFAIWWCNYCPGVSVLFLDVVFMKPCLFSVIAQICPVKNSTTFFHRYSALGIWEPCGFEEDHTTSGWTEESPPPISLQGSRPISIPTPRKALPIMSSSPKSHYLSTHVATTRQTSSFDSPTINASATKRDTTSSFDLLFQNAFRYSGLSIICTPSRKVGSSKTKMCLRCLVVIYPF